MVADNLVAAINTASIGVTAQNQGIGRVSLGRISENRVDASDLAGVVLRRGIVSDGEVLTIRQGTNEVNYEFEAAVGGGGVAANNVAVPFQPGSTIGCRIPPVSVARTQSS